MSTESDSHQKSDEICKQVFILGKVQGVGFRNACFMEVKRIGGLKGWVRNLQTGDVEIVVQGSRGKIKELINWCHTKVPPPARVDAVIENEVHTEPGLKDFGIRKA